MKDKTGERNPYVIGETDLTERKRRNVTSITLLNFTLHPRQIGLGQIGDISSSEIWSEIVLYLEQPHPRHQSRTPSEGSVGSPTCVDTESSPTSKKNWTPN